MAERADQGHGQEGAQRGVRREREGRRGKGRTGTVTPTSTSPPPGLEAGGSHAERFTDGESRADARDDAGGVEERIDQGRWR